MTELLILLGGGIKALTEYLSVHVLACLVPAFFIAGGISAFISTAAVLKYFGPSAKKILSYSVASVSGAILAVCSCTVLPLFGAIYKRGAGLGPAVTFLYAAPAINILAVVYSARLLGYDLGVARAIIAIVFSIVLGLAMAWLYRKEEAGKKTQAFVLPQDSPGAKSPIQQLVFIGTLLGILIFAAASNWIMTALMLVALGYVLWRWFSRGEIKHWLTETLRYVRLILPWLLGGVFIAGVLTIIIPEDVIATFVGDNSLLSNFTASFVGMLMYFATLTEVPIVKALMDLGMAKGPALALLLAGPALSLPNLLVIRKIMGTKKALTYSALVVILSTFAGFIFGLVQ
jgi:uncharacterized membrane protein YraQ (UPF0718 family)